MIIRDYKCLDKDGKDPFKNDRKLIDQEQLKLLRFYKYGMYMDEWHFVLTSEEGCIPAPTSAPTPVPTITPVPTPTLTPTPANTPTPNHNHLMWFISVCICICIIALIIIIV